MQTVLVLIVLIMSSLFSAPPQGDVASVPRPNESDGARCTADWPEDSVWPMMFEAGRDFVECLTVDELTATFSNTYPVQISLNVTGQSWREMDDYGYEFQVEQWRAGDVLLVAIYRHIMPVSKAIPAPYTNTITINGGFEAGSYTLRVNNYSLEIAVPDAPPPGSDAPPPYPDERFHTRSYAVIENVGVNTSYPMPMTVSLHVTGYERQRDCGSRLHIDQRREGNWVYVEIYRLIDPDAWCPAEHTRLNEYIQLDDVLFEGTYILQVNDYVTTFSVPYPPPPPPPPPNRSYAIIENVEVIVFYSYPAQITLHVTGYYASGCRGELQIDQWREGSWVYVDIYQWIDPMMMCPEMLVRLDEYIPIRGGFENGTYIFQVNDYTLTYTIPPIMYDDIPPELMPVEPQMDR